MRVHDRRLPAKSCHSDAYRSGLAREPGWHGLFAGKPAPTVHGSDVVIGSEGVFNASLILLATKGRESTAGSTGERNTLSLSKNMECEQWFTEHESELLSKVVFSQLNQAAS